MAEPLEKAANEGKAATETMAEEPAAGEGGASAEEQSEETKWARFVIFALSRKLNYWLRAAVEVKAVQLGLRDGTLIAFDDEPDNCGASTWSPGAWRPGDLARG